MAHKIENIWNLILKIWLTQLERTSLAYHSGGWSTNIGPQCGPTCRLEWAELVRWVGSSDYFWEIQNPKVSFVETFIWYDELSWCLINWLLRPRRLECNDLGPCIRSSNYSDCTKVKNEICDGMATCKMTRQLNWQISSVDVVGPCWLSMMMCQLNWDDDVARWHGCQWWRGMFVVGYYVMTWQLMLAWPWMDNHRWSGRWHVSDDVARWHLEWMWH